MSVVRAIGVGNGQQSRKWCLKLSAITRKRGDPSVIADRFRASHEKDPRSWLAHAYTESSTGRCATTERRISPARTAELDSSDDVIPCVCSVPPWRYNPPRSSGVVRTR